MHHLINQKVLATTQNWFYGSDGKQYRSVWGTLKSVNEAGKTLGFIPNRSHANWFVKICDMIIMGCQIMYLLKCDEQPNTGNVMETYLDKETNKMVEYEKKSEIFITT